MSKMGIKRCKTGREHTNNEESEDDQEDEQPQQDLTTATSALSFRILELPAHLIYDVLSRLPPKTVFWCRCVCKRFLQILTDPYFAKIHLVKAPNVAASLIFQDSRSGFVFVCMLDLDATSSASSCCPNHGGSHPCQALAKQNPKFHFGPGLLTPVGSCNGLLCLQHDSRPKPLFYICNPILGEFTVLPQITTLTSISYVHSGFGFCPKTKQYKVICCMTALFGGKLVAEIHTVGTESWRSIGDAPWPKRASFDALVNGILHWVTDSVTAFKLICSFDLEAEQFHYIPAPTHFYRDYVTEISWINVGILGRHLCLCYVHGAQFYAWVMKDYGVKESWTKEFVINIAFYCGLHARYLHHPIKFLNNGDLLFVCDSKFLVSYSPGKRTFREFKDLGAQKVRAFAHIPSFVSLKEICSGEKVKNVKWANGQALVWPVQ